MTLWHSLNDANTFDQQSSGELEFTLFLKQSKAKSRNSQPLLILVVLTIVKLIYNIFLIKFKTDNHSSLYRTSDLRDRRWKTEQLIFFQGSVKMNK